MFFIDGSFFNYIMKKKKRTRESNLSHPFHEPKCFVNIFTPTVCYLHSSHDMSEKDIL